MNWQNKLNQIFETSEKVKFIDVFNTQGDLLATINEESSENAKDKLFRFLNNWEASKFVLELRTDKSSQRKLKHTIFNSDEVLNINASTTKAVEFDEEKQNQLIIQGVNKALKEREEREERENFLREKEEFKTSTGKIALILEQIVLKFIQGKSGLNLATVNGANIMNEEKETVSDDLEETVKKRKYAIEILVNNIDADTLVLFANKIKSQPSIVQTLKTFL